MKVLKQSTASQSVLLGPFVDDTDGTTAETGLTIANTDIRLSKAGGNMAAKNSGGGTHDELGYYTITLDATDTATVGILQVVCKMSGALVVEDTFQVVEESVYDGLYASGASLVTEATVADAVLDEALSGHTTAGTLGKAIADTETDVAAVLVDTGTTIPGTISTIDSNVDAILVDTGTTIPGTITTVDSNVDAIKAKTDSLTFSAAGFVDANVMEVNDNGGLTGDGDTTPISKA